MISFSVIIPTYNHAEFVLKAILSVKNNTEVDTEIIVINDGSTDTTHDLLHNYPGIKYIKQENSGASQALNIGLKLATHNFVAILNDDDYFENDHLIKSYYELLSTGSEILIAQCRPFGDSKFKNEILNHQILCDNRIFQYGLIETLLQLNWAVSTSALVFRKSLLENDSDYFSNFKMCHDFEFLLRHLVVRKRRFYLTNRLGWNYRCHGSNSSHAIQFSRRRAEWYVALYSNLNQLDTWSLRNYIEEIGLEHLGISRSLSQILWDATRNFEFSSLEDVIVGVESQILQG